MVCWISFDLENAMYHLLSTDEQKRINLRSHEDSQSIALLVDVLFKIPGFLVDVETEVIEFECVEVCLSVVLLVVLANLLDLDLEFPLILFAECGVWIIVFVS